MEQSSRAAPPKVPPVVIDGVRYSQVLNARRLGIDKQVNFCGGVSDEELDTLFRRTSVFLMPAVQGYGLPALEALIRGVPVILHRQSGVSEVLNCPPWAESIENGIDDLAQAIDRMADNIVTGAIPMPPPPVPTAEQWAGAIAGQCGWI